MAYDLRNIEPISVDGIEVGMPHTCEPKFERVDPANLYVDTSYQRAISERGVRQINQIIEKFCWTKFKPPICAYAKNSHGAPILMVLDGQHTAIAAASNPNVHFIPVMIVDAADTKSQAAAFVGQNTQRLGVSSLQVHKAAVVACDETALDVENVCKRAGLKVLNTHPSTSRYHARETIAVATIRGLVNRHTAMGARKILEVIANADFAPVTAMHIKAVELLMTHKDFKDKFDPKDLTATMIDMYLVAEDDAKVFAHANRLPVWKALAVIWFRKTKKQRHRLSLVS